MVDPSLTRLALIGIYAYLSFCLAAGDNLVLAQPEQPAARAKKFKQLDRNSDGKLTPDEFRNTELFPSALLENSRFGYPQV